MNIKVQKLLNFMFKVKVDQVRKFFDLMVGFIRPGQSLDFDLQRDISLAFGLLLYGKEGIYAQENGNTKIIHEEWVLDGDVIICKLKRKKRKI